MKTRLVLAVILGIALILALVGGSALLWRFFIVALAVLLPSYLWPRLSLRGVTVKVGETPELGQVGFGFESGFTMLNKSRLPSPLVEVREVTDLPGYENAAAFNLPSQGQHTWQARVPLRRRGRYTLGTLDVKTADPLGIFPVNRRFGESRDIVVYPATFDLPHFQALPRLEPGLNRRRWLASETGPGASRVREYTSGDSLRHIHWPTTAHTGELMVKEFDPDRANYAFKNMWIVPDMSRSAWLGDNDDSIGEYTINITASIAKKYLDSGKYVGMLAAGSPPCLFPPESGEARLDRMLKALALINAGEEYSMADLLEEAVRFEEGSSVIVIMPSHRPPIIPPLRRIADRGAVVNVILLDSLSFGGDTSAFRPARSLIASEIQAYIVRRGDRLADALDSRHMAWRQHLREVEVQ